MRGSTSLTKLHRIPFWENASFPLCVTQLFNAPTELETHSRHGSTHDSGLKLALPSFAAWLLSNVLRVVFVCRVDDMDGKDERCGEGQKVGQSSYKEPEENIFCIKHSLS